MKLTKLLLAIPALLCTSAMAQTAEKNVNVYSYRDPVLMAPLYEAFKAESGISVNPIFAKDGLEERIQLEGKASPADVLLSVDVQKLNKAKNIGITQSFIDEKINKAIPALYRDKDGAWVGLTQRARFIYASKTRVTANDLRYEDLVKPEFKGKVCLRSGLHPYNLGLISSIIANNGEAAAEKWLNDLKANLARKPSGGDREQAQAIANGVCDVALGNSYYVALMQTNEKNPEQKEWANAIKVIFPNAKDRGTQVNISGAALTKYAPNVEHGKTFIRFLASEKAQKLYADSVYEYPTRADMPMNEIVAKWGTLKADILPLSKIADNYALAAKLVEKTGFDN